MPITKTDFENYKTKYEAEKARYMALEIGQTVYVFTGYDNFAHEIVSIDIDNRTLECLDHSLKGKPTTLFGGWVLHPLAGM